MSLLELVPPKVLTFIPVGVPDPGAGTAPGDTEGKITTVIGWVTWLAFAVCALGVIIAGGMMALGQRRGEGGEHAARLGWVLAGCIVVGSAAGLVNALI
ncbi:TrbC/VirB2 family protein [Kribbella deserti]|uniref:TrbC/VirB2 family protein n=1 Tax=Kribbella deserti TaxID=1926257 RepID=A0ABV6QJU9_9ACTN